MLRNAAPRPAMAHTGVAHLKSVAPAATEPRNARVARTAYLYLGGSRSQNSKGLGSATCASTAWSLKRVFGGSGRDGPEGPRPRARPTGPARPDAGKKVSTGETNGALRGPPCQGAAPRAPGTDGRGGAATDAAPRWTPTGSPPSSSSRPSRWWPRSPATAS